jgi:zinc finger BED domain-containing protein 1 (E3 SUMO-protein ligase ZBED1)
MTDPLQWWYNHGRVSFPMLQGLAFKYLTIPATSVPSERLFSSAGDIISSKRASLGAELARELIFLNGNMKRK